MNYVSRQNVKDRVKLYEVLPISTPFRIHLEPSSFCNLKCKFCPLHQDDGLHISKSFMEIDLFEKVLEQLKMFPEQVKVINFCGFGEPLLHKYIVLH